MVFGYCYVAAAVGRILESDIFQQRFFGNDRRVKCFCRIQVSDSCYISICPFGVRCSVGFAHNNVG